MGKTVHGPNFRILFQDIITVARRVRQETRHTIMFFPAMTNHEAHRITLNHACGPPSENVKSLRFGITSNRTGVMDSITQPSAKASCNSFLDTRRGPCVPGSSSLKHIRNNLPPDFRTDARPSTYFLRSSSENP